MISACGWINRGSSFWMHWDCEELLGGKQCSGMVGRGGEGTRRCVKGMDACEHGRRHGEVRECTGVYGLEG